MPTQVDDSADIATAAVAALGGQDAVPRVVLNLRAAVLEGLTIMTEN